MEDAADRPIIVEVLDDSIKLIDEALLLSPLQHSQLRFWSFVSSPDKKEWISPKLQVLDKVIAYLEHKNEVSLEEHAEALYAKKLNEKKLSLQISSIGAAFKDGKYDLRELNAFREYMNKHLARELKTHQLKAAYHASLLKRSANFSVPGSGKTSVVLALYEKLRRENKVDFLFVVGPVSSFGPWRSEFEKTIGRNPFSVVLSGLQKSVRLQNYAGRTTNDFELYLTSFQTLLNDAASIEEFFGRESSRAFLVIDEAHYIKRLDGLWASAALKISKKCEYRMILTGTPMPRAYSDLFNLFDFLWEDLSPLDSRSKIMILEAEKSQSEETAQEIVEQKVGGLFYRVRKKDLQLKPQVFHDPIRIEMNPLEREIYRLIYNRIIDLSQNDYLQNFETLARLKKARIMRLRQCASYVPLLRSALNDSDSPIAELEPVAQTLLEYESVEMPSKLEKLMELVRTLNSDGKKVLIWTNFIGTLKIICDEVSKQGISVKAIYGEVPVEKEDISDVETREKIRDEFVYGDLEVLVANPAACAESISLHTSCQHAIYYDLSYNCAQYLQSLDRIHRVGGSELKEANYYFLQYANSIDEDILSSVQDKAARMQRLIDMDFAIYSLDMSDIDNEDISAYDRLFKML